MQLYLRHFRQFDWTDPFERSQLITTSHKEFSLGFHHYAQEPV